ncbi:MAG TPA: hypothetical protein VGK49_07720, partial [Ilumatobacteraceae bacterium]
MKHRKSSKFLAVLAGVSLIAAACGGDDDDGDGDAVTEDTGGDTEGTEGGTETTEAAPVEGAEGGTLIWAHEQEPPDLHLDDPENNLSITSWIRQSMWEGLYGITASTEYFPELLAEEGVITENGDGSVTGTFVLRDGLTWSDGD